MGAPPAAGRLRLLAGAGKPLPPGAGGRQLPRAALPHALGAALFLQVLGDPEALRTAAQAPGRGGLLLVGAGDAPLIHRVDHLPRLMAAVSPTL